MYAVGGAAAPSACGARTDKSSGGQTRQAQLGRDDSASTPSAHEEAGAASALNFDTEVTARRREEREWRLRQMQREAELLGLDLPPGAAADCAPKLNGQPDEPLAAGLGAKATTPSKTGLAQKLSGKRYFCPVTNETFQTWEELAAHLLALRELMDEDEALRLASQLEGTGDAALAEVVMRQRAVVDGAGEGADESNVACLPEKLEASPTEENLNAAIVRIERLQAFADDCKRRYMSDECAASYSAEQSQLHALYAFVKEKMHCSPDFAQEACAIDRCVLQLLLAFLVFRSHTPLLFC